MKQQPTPIEVNREKYYNTGFASFYKNGKYFIWFWVEFSKAKTKRRKRNKQSRKQRKINNR